MTQPNVTETIDVAATPDQTWALVGDFAGLVGWFPAVTESVVEGSGIGALRYLTMPDGNKLTERQEARDEAGRAGVVLGQLDAVALDLVDDPVRAGAEMALDQAHGCARAHRCPGHRRLVNGRRRAN